MFLGLDIGTTNVKTLVVDAAGVTRSEGSAPVESFHLGGGGVEQDIRQIWESVCSAIRQALDGIDPAAVQAVGISSQGGALQVCDPNGEPIGRVVSWLDQRAADRNRQLTDTLGADWFSRRVGHPRSGLAIGQLLRLAEENPPVFRASSIGFVGDCVVRRLTGRAAHDGTSAALTLLYNSGLRDYDPDVLRHLGVAKSQLPKIVPVDEPAGLLTQEAARQTSLPAGIPVSAAVHDQYAAALAAGAVRPRITMLGTGTVWVLLAVADQPQAPAAPNAFVCHHLVPGLHGQILSMINGGSALSWVLGLTGANGKCGDSIESLLESVSQGSEGVTFRPFLAPSAPSGVAPGSRGGFSGLQLSHRAPHLVRAVLEGLAFELRRHLCILDRAGITTSNLVLSGAAAASPVTSQLLADVTGLPLVRAANANSAFGAAILARKLAAPALSLASLAETMSPSASAVHPGPRGVSYSGLYDEYLRSLDLST
jgi:sugar (pentulose or hexulose) kinase